MVISPFQNDQDQQPPRRALACRQIKRRLERFLRDPGTIDWNGFCGSLQELASSGDDDDDADERDPLGRSFLTVLLSKNPPIAVLDAALRAFPESLTYNSVAFFAACRYGTTETVSHLMNYLLRTITTKTTTTTSPPTTTNVASPATKEQGNECPYPWILSDHVSAEGAKVILQAYPHGILQPSSCLASLCPLDYFLMAPDMVRQRNFGSNMWTKFKLMLVAAECCKQDQQDPSCQKGGTISPIHVILERIMMHPGVLDDTQRAEHIIWLLHQLHRSDPWLFQKQTVLHKDEGLVYPLHYVLGFKCTQNKAGLVASRELVKLLLAAHPPSARCASSKDGRLPIYMAIENGWPCHDLILSIFPEALDMRDPATGFVPFQTAATCKVPGSSLSLDVTFELLRANPTYASSSHGNSYTSRHGATTVVPAPPATRRFREQVVA